ncbi:MAG TPA: DUF1127 domain-containing protein [Reyranella sp.]
MGFRDIRQRGPARRYPAVFRKHRYLDIWRRRARGRRQLARMSARELRDIGCTQSDAHREINKPFWRA